MSFSIQRSVVEQFNFNGKTVRSLYIKNIGECLVASDVYRAVGYKHNSNGKRAIQTYVPDEYKIRLRHVPFGLEKGINTGALHPDTILLKEPGFYCFLLRCGKEEAKPFMKWVVEEVLPREVRKLSKVIEDKDSALALLNDDLTEREYQIQQLGFNNTGLQGEIRAKDQEIARLHERVVSLALDPGKNNVVVIVRKHTREKEDEYFKYPYYIARIQRRSITSKRQWILEKFPRSEEIVVIDNPNSVHVFNRFEEEGHIERYGCHFRLVDLTREDLYDMGIPAIEV